MPRQYPALPRYLWPARRPISFVVVRFSPEYEHNFERSTCPSRSPNQVVRVDNEANLFHDNLSSAVLHGVALARHEIIAVVHEDVLLPPRWQQRFEKSLRQLERVDPRWGVLGSVGWDAAGEYAGHWSDPHQFKNTFGRAGPQFREVDKLDEQLLVFHRDRLPDFDTSLPGIHFLGDDLRYQMRAKGLKCYAVNAPTIHKYADREGARIVEHGQSGKIRDRNSLTYVADEAVCLDYVVHKHPGFRSLSPLSQLAQVAGDVSSVGMVAPVIMVSCDPPGDSLVQSLSAQVGPVVGEGGKIAPRRDALLVELYKLVIEKYRCHADWQRERTASRLGELVSTLEPAQGDAPAWFINFPAGYLVLPELARVFPGARYLFLPGNAETEPRAEAGAPVSLDNHIGRIALPAAYDFFNLPRTAILSDSPLRRASRLRAHCAELVRRHCEHLPAGCVLSLEYAGDAARAGDIVAAVSRWLGLPGTGPRGEQ